MPVVPGTLVRVRGLMEVVRAITLLGVRSVAVMSSAGFEPTSAEAAAAAAMSAAMAIGAVPASFFSAASVAGYVISFYAFDYVAFLPSVCGRGKN